MRSRPGVKEGGNWRDAVVGENVVEEKEVVEKVVGRDVHVVGSGGRCTERTEEIRGERWVLVSFRLSAPHGHDAITYINIDNFSTSTSTTPSYRHRHLHNVKSITLRA